MKFRGKMRAQQSGQVHPVEPQKTAQSQPMQPQQSVESQQSAELHQPVQPQQSTDPQKSVEPEPVESKPVEPQPDPKDVKIAQLDAKVKEYVGDLQRTRADFENFRKQVDLQKENAMNAAKLATVYKVLPLLDDIDRAIKTYEQLQPLAKSFDKTLRDLNLTRIESSAGAEFDPDLHDAMTVEGDGEKEVIAETLRPGYYFEGAVLRPAMVKVKKQ